MLVGIGSGAEKGLEEAGIGTYDEAVAACAQLTAASGAKCQVDGLICFLCLSQHKEAVAAPDFPEPAPPVSVRDDLGLDVPAPAARPRITRKAAAAPPPAIASIMAWVLPELLLWSHIGAASSGCQCCSAFQACGLFMEIRIVASRRNIAYSVASLLTREAPALLQSGVSRSTLLRTVACAWDNLDKCARVRDGEHVMSLALLRLSVKLEFALPEHVDIALKLLGAADEKPALLSLERRLVMMLGSSDAQPPARHLSTRTSGVLIEHIVNQLGCQG